MRQWEVFGTAGLVVCALLLWQTGPVLAEEAELPPTRAQWSRCWQVRGGLTPGHVALAEEVVGSTELVTTYTLRLPYRLARATFAEQGPVRLSPEILRRHEVPLWRAETVTAHMIAGQALSLTHGVNACLPYPVKSVALSAQPVVRGQTLALAVETEQDASCQIELFEQVSPCYRDGDSRFFVFAGTSALLDPGVYPLRVVVTFGGEEGVLELPLQIAAGQYGYQFIDPPPELSELMMPEVMRSEETYLQAWRGLRSPVRTWDLPLALPLPEPVPLSAGYGDRRSYGGMVDGYHSGLDYRAWGGMAVLAPADGVVVMAQTLKVRGNAVLIDHGWGLITGYWHLSSFDVQVGDAVRKGEAFATVGTTGLSTGAHLHWEVWANGVSVNGQQWLLEDAFGEIVPLPLEAELGEGVVQ